MTTTTLTTLMRNLCALLHEGASRFVAISTTTTIGNAGKTSLIDSLLAYSSEDVDLLGQCYVRIDSQVTGGPAPGEISRVTAGGLTVATGEVTVSPAFSAQVKSGTDYSLWTLTQPAIAKRTLNRILGDKKREVITPVTLITDGDMETTGVTNWTDVGTCTTKEKVTTAAYVRHGTQSLHLIAGAAGGGKRTASIACIGQKTWLLAVTLQVPVGTWTVAAYDATNSVNILTATSNQAAWQTVFFAFTVPTSCQNIQVRITGSANLDECYIDNAILWPAQQREYELPSWIDDPSDSVQLGFFRMRSSPAGNHLYIPEEGDWLNWECQKAYVDEAGAHPFRVLIDTPISYPLYLKAKRPFTTLSAETDTTTADAQGLILDTAWELYEMMAREEMDTKKAPLIAALGSTLGRRRTDRLLGTREGTPKASVNAGKWTSY